MNDREREKWDKQLNKNQQIMIENGNNYWQWIKYLDKENKAQSQFDKEVTKSLQDHESKLSSVIELVGKSKN